MRFYTLRRQKRQCATIGRAFVVRNALILALDEATDAPDSKAEAKVQAAMDRLAEHGAVICAAHRLSTFATMDRIIVVTKGRMVEAGSFDELPRKGSAVARMAARQSFLAKQASITA